MGLKENFSQAVRELTGGAKEEEKKKSPQVSDLKKAMDDGIGEESSTDYSSAPYYKESPQQAQHDFSGQNGYDAPQTNSYVASNSYGAAQSSYGAAQGSFGQDDYQQPGYTQGGYSQQSAGASRDTYSRENNSQSFGVRYGGTSYGSTIGGSVPPATSDPARDFNTASDDELTIISKNTIIDGNIRSFANMNIDGDVRGDVETTKNVNVNGRIIGDITCNNACLTDSKVQGNVQLKGAVRVERDTLLLGDLNSTYATINGKIKGNVEVSGKAEIKADSVIFGDISASTITVDDGAIIQGYVSTTFLNKEESASIFPDSITIGE